MSESATPKLQRLLSSVGLYAVAAAAQRAAGFLLIPVYTRLIDPASYGVLELLNTFASIAFMFMTVGLGSAINKCYHRDCDSPAEQAAVLSTAVVLDLPVLAGGTLVFVLLAQPVSRLLVGSGDAAHLLVLAILSGIPFGLTGLALASLRAQERTTAFCVLSVTQFVLALGLNLLLVAGYGWGVEGVLWGNLLSNLIALPLALTVAARGVQVTFNRRLVRPLLRFGAFLIPVMLSGWVMDLSDRWVLRLYRDLNEVAVYGIGYKFGMLMELAVVWPFQLAWPAFSFAISRRPGHQATYARTLTYFTLVLLFASLIISVLAHQVLPVVVGPAYYDAYRVVPLVALAYALNGIQYCVAPGVHIAGRTRYLSLFAALGAVVNLSLNFLLIPRFGMMGAAWSTVLAFLVVAVASTLLAQRVYPVPYEYARLAKVLAAGLLAYILAMTIPIATATAAMAWQLGMPLIVFPAVLTAMGFLDDRERAALAGLLRRYAISES